MSRLRVHGPSLRRRPVRAVRAVAEQSEIDVDAAPVRRWPAVVVGLLGLLVAGEFAFGLVVLS
jgi:hypothetical protein